MGDTSITLFMKQINKLEVVLAEQNKTGKWLAESLGKNEATVFSWCANEMQPSLEIFVNIANILNVNVNDLLVSTKKAN